MKPGYFGPPKLRKAHEDLIQTPIGAVCALCAEAVVDGDIGTVNNAGQVWHYECSLRALVGSVGHQSGRCSCFGGNEEDPEGMTYRQAAIAAARLWESKNKPTAGARYRILRQDRMRAIECLDCGKTSYNTNDVKQRYCGYCHKFHHAHDLYEGRLVMTQRVTQGMDVQEKERDIPAGSRGYICGILPDFAEHPYAIIFPMQSRTVVMATRGELLDAGIFQLLED